MNRNFSRWLTLSAVLSGGSVLAVPTSGENPYSAIITRNGFRLSPPPPPIAVPTNVAPPKVTTKVELTGISIEKGVVWAWFMIPAKTPTEPTKYLTLREGERDGIVEVQKIDVEKGEVQILNSGDSLMLSFADKNKGATPGAVPGAVPLPVQTSFAAPQPNTGASGQFGNVVANTGGGGVPNNPVPQPGGMAIGGQPVNNSVVANTGGSVVANTAGSGAMAARYNLPTTPGAANVVSTPAPQPTVALQNSTDGTRTIPTRTLRLSPAAGGTAGAATATPQAVEPVSAEAAVVNHIIYNEVNAADIQARRVPPAPVPPGLMDDLK